MNLQMIQSLSIPVVGLTNDQFVELYNEFVGSSFDSLDDIINDMKLQKLQSLLTPTSSNSKSTSVSKWDRNTDEGKRNNALASQQSRQRRKEREAKERAELEAKAKAFDELNDDK